MDTPAVQPALPEEKPEAITEVTSPLTAFDIFFMNFRVTLAVGLIGVPFYIGALPGAEGFLLPSLAFSLLAIPTLARLVLQVWPAARRLRYESTVVLDSVTGKWRSRGLLRKPAKAYQRYVLALQKFAKELPMLSKQEVVYLDVKQVAGSYSFSVKKRVDVTTEEKLEPPR